MSLAKRRRREAALLFSLRDPLVQFGHILQGRLFPVLEAELGALSDLQQQLVRTLALLQLDAFVEVRCGRGRPAHDRAAIARLRGQGIRNPPRMAAKPARRDRARLRGQGGVQSADDAGVLDRLRADIVLRRLCGWETAAGVPDERVCSRSFAEFAQSQWAQRVHAALIERTQGERLIGHVSRDATALEAPEKPQPKPKTAASGPEPRYRKGRQKARPVEQMRRLERQCSGSLTLEQMLRELPRACDVGLGQRAAHWVHVAGVAARVRRGLQDQQPGPQVVLDRLQAAPGRGRRTGPHQLCADLGRLARQPGRRAAG
jgi:hypothetical protein